ncbi:hypothetical protein [Priestia aryabhattai]|uniref:hypothetical protein n=1 Tax=Priestia aryabhattai TaxID=412384 RepID=UPI002E219A3C|nr:hypothetical protein [Priestia aryabhattai]
MSYYRGINSLINTIKEANKSGKNVNLLIGAGCSVSAEIPAATGILNEIKDRYPEEYEQAQEKSYAECMAKLTATERRDLISGFVNEAKVNWAHIGIAQLLKSGYINRVLTTNFDNLVVRACSMVSEFPAIYDLATTNTFNPHLIPEKAVFYLHGQHTGFILCNTEEELNKQIENIKPVFGSLKEKSVWIIVGYSGDNDPIFQLLSEEEKFEHRLFWIGFKDHKPSKALESQLLDENKYAFFIKNYDADDFFVSLAKGLECFPPKIIQKPFSYLKDTLDTLCEYKMPEQREGYSSSLALNLSTQNIINRAVEEIENNKNSMAKHYYRSALYEEVVKLYSEFETEDYDSEFINYYVKSLLNLETEEHIATSIKVINDTLEKSPNKELKALKEICLIRLVEYKEEEEKTNILTEMCDRLEINERLDEGNVDVLNHLGIALGKLAHTKKEAGLIEEAEELFTSSYIRFKSALMLRNKSLGPLLNMGLCICNLIDLDNENYLKIKDLFQEFILIIEDIVLDEKNSKLHSTYKNKIITRISLMTRFILSKFSETEELKDTIDKIILILDRLTQGLDANVNALKTFGLCFERLGNNTTDINEKLELYNKGIEKYKIAIKLNIDDEFINRKLAMLFKKISRLEIDEKEWSISNLKKASYHVEESLKFSGENKEILWIKALTLMELLTHTSSDMQEERLDILSESKLTLEKLLDINPNDSKSLELYGRTLELYSSLDYKEETLPEEYLERSITSLEKAYSIKNSLDKLYVLIEVIEQYTIKGNKSKEQTLELWNNTLIKLNTFPGENKDTIRYFNTKNFVLNRIADIHLEENRLVALEYFHEQLELHSHCYTLYPDDNINLETWIQTLLKVAEIEQNQQKKLNLIEKSLEKFEMIQARDYPTSNVGNMLNNISLDLIEEKNFVTSKEILDKLLKLDPRNLYYNATFGMWYFRNTDIVIEESEEKGKFYYQQAISFANENQDEVLNSLTQKFNYELSLFYIEREGNEQKALPLVIKGLQLGNMENQSFYNDLLKLMNKFNLNFGNTDVAASKEEKN